MTGSDAAMKALSRLLACDKACDSGCDTVQQKLSHCVSHGGVKNRGRATTSEGRCDTLGKLLAFPARRAQP